MSVKRDPQGNAQMPFMRLPRLLKSSLAMTGRASVLKYIKAPKGQQQNEYKGYLWAKNKGI